MNNDDIDRLLGSDLLDVPADFVRRVMCEVHAQPARASRFRVPHALRWLGAALAAGLGVSQVLAFIFGLWTTSVAM
ncbi:hypothetical protein [Aquabacterium sp.]|uniref:hypothetical protein n=1 Tax=Aquabacterium sp. TaxID=1872578 RepID=UPI0025BB649B|nr:hypothetical protein [Aquabacterium sp.]